MPVPNIIKIFHINKNLLSAQDFCFKILSGEITRKRTQYELFFLHAAFLLDLVYVPTIYYQIISNSVGVMACTRFLLHGS